VLSCGVGDPEHCWYENATQARGTWPRVRNSESLDDASRVAYAALLPDQGAVCSVAFRRAAVAYHAGLVIC
jgi:hypothetical protein